MFHKSKELSTEENAAKKLVEDRGFRKVRLIESQDGSFLFSCKKEDGIQTEVLVQNGLVFPAPM